MIVTFLSIHDVPSECSEKQKKEEYDSLARSPRQPRIGTFDFPKKTHAYNAVIPIVENQCVKSRLHLFSFLYVLFQISFLGLSGERETIVMLS